MSADVTVKTGVLPVGIVLGLGRQPCSFQVGSQQTVGIEPHQVVNVRLLVSQELAFSQPDVVDGESLHLRLELSRSCHHCRSDGNGRKKSFHVVSFLFVD